MNPDFLFQVVPGVCLQTKGPLGSEPPGTVSGPQAEVDMLQTLRLATSLPSG